jgi:hypothetical protein
MAIVVRDSGRTSRAPTPVNADRTGYTIAGRKYPRVTSILGCMAKPALVGWAAKSVAEYAVEHVETWQQLPPPDAVRLLKGAPWSERDAAGDRGSAIHAAIESYLRGQSFPDGMTEEELAVAKVAERFLREHKPEPIGVEVTVYSPLMGYAGTCDLPCRIGERIWLLDWKTSKGIYGETALQLAAYALAERAIIDGEDMWAPWMEQNPRLGVVHLTPTGYTLWRVTTDMDVLRAAWRALLKVHGWMKVQDEALEKMGWIGSLEMEE